MSKKNAGWIIIGIAIVLGILHLLDVINAATTAVLFVLSMIVFTGKSGCFKKKKPEPSETEEK